MSKLSFEFKSVELSEEEFLASQKKVSTQFTPGTYDLKIMECKFQKMSEKDPTWASFRLILAQDGDKVIVGEKDGKETIQVQDKKGKPCKVIRTTIMVPTQKETYNSANPTFMFSKLREFFLSIGETLLCSKESMKAIIPKYFGKPEALKGTVLNCKIGYRGPYLQKDGDKIYIFNVKGEKICEEGFEDFDAAEVHAATALELKINRFVELLKFNPSSTEQEGEAIIIPDEEW